MDTFLLVWFPYNIQPSHISAQDYSLCMDIQESVHILCVVICITHKHACLTPVIQFGSHFLSFMDGNHCHFSKCSQTSRILCILSIEQCVRGFCSFWSHHNVIQLCCCGNHFTLELFLVLWFKPCLNQHGSCSAH